MSRPIDADALIAEYGDWYTEEGTEEGYIGTVKGIVDGMPTIEPERKTGWWVPQNHNRRNGYVTTTVYFYPKCSECGRSGDYGMNYCPNCGADMRGEQDE